MNCGTPYCLNRTTGGRGRAGGRGLCWSLVGCWLAELLVGDLLAEGRRGAGGRGACAPALPHLPLPATYYFQLVAGAPTQGCLAGLDAGPC